MYSNLSRNTVSQANINNSPSLDLDLQRLISLIRQRQSSLTMLLQQKKQKIWERPEWLLKQCEYQQKENRLTRQIRGIILRWVLLGNQQILAEENKKCVRSFWVKVKMVMKTSLERIKLMNLLNYQLFQKYQGIIDAMNIGYDRAAGIAHYRDIEDMVKNRNKAIHQILGCGKMQIIQRERSEQSAKVIVIRQCPSESKIKKSLIFTKGGKDQITVDSKTMKRPLSYQSNKMRMNSKQFLMTRKMKKIDKYVDNYEDKLMGVMDVRMDYTIDRKKNIEQNLESLFDQIMQKNMNNHRMISKFIFSHSGKVLKRFPSRRNIKLASKKLIDNQKGIQNALNHTPRLKKNQKKKAKISLTCGRVSSAKIKRKQINKTRHSQIIDREQLKLPRTKKFL